MFRISMCLLSFTLLGCSTPENKAPETLTVSAVFDINMAKDNLEFIKDQQLKMIKHVATGTNLERASGCEDANVICFPRAKEHDAIFLEKPTKWTNGFYVGLLWKLLTEQEAIDNFTSEQRTLLLSTAKHYQKALTPESLRGSTHDLGFILYDSFGEALNFDGLTEEERKDYIATLDQGRNTLASRYSEKYGVIKSWDFGPTLRVHTREDGEINKHTYDLATPWTFPVIVDNMMNLEFLLSSANPQHQALALSHAKNTYLNHYFYQNTDVDKKFPIAYHLFDYDSQRPGNWQGVSNVSAWARGQGWSLYGYVTVIEALQKLNDSQYDLPDFDAHYAALLSSIERLLGNDFVPPWDYYAVLPNAAELAQDQSSETVQYSRILDLCDFKVPSDIIPYVGYRPIAISTDILANSTVSQLENMTSVYGESFVQKGQVMPCGTKPYKQQATHIPKDSSAAALYAAALYRYATTSTNETLKKRSVALADNIMAELTNHYLTLKNKESDYDLGFVLTEATGNLPEGSEINTSMIYADFYFLEANILKLKLLQTLPQ